MFFDRLDDPSPARQLWVNPEGNILHLAVDQVTGTLFFAQGVGAGSLIMAVPLDGEEPLLFTTNPNFLNQTPAIDQNTGRLYFSRLFGGSQDIYGVYQNRTGLLRVTTPGLPACYRATVTDSRRNQRPRARACGERRPGRRRRTSIDTC